MNNKLLNKNFKLLIIGQVISLFGSSIQRFALSLYLLDLTGSATIFASVLAISMVPIIIVAPIAGSLADRLNKKKLMVGLDFISALVMLVYGTVLFAGKDSYNTVALMMIILSAISTIYQATVTASIPNITKEENLLKANSIVYQVSSMSNFLGPILAGVIYGFLGIKGIIIINGISFLISGIMELFIKIPHVKKIEKENPIIIFKNDMKDSYIYLKYKNPTIFKMIFTSGLYNLFLVPIFSVGAPYIIKILLGFDSQIYGLSEGIIAMGMIIGASIVSFMPNKFHIKRIHKILYISCGAMFMMGASLMLPLSSRIATLSIFTLGGMGIMMVLGIANVISGTFIQISTDRNMLGKVSAFGAAFATMCVPFGQIIFGGAVEAMDGNLHILVMLFALLTFGVTLIVRNNVKSIKKENKDENIYLEAS